MAKYAAWGDHSKHGKDVSFTKQGVLLTTAHSLVCTCCDVCDSRAHMNVRQ